MASVFDPLISVAKKPISQEDFSYIVSILHAGENDHTVAILGATLAESALAQAVRSRLRESNSDHSELFRSNAPLSSFSSLTQMGFALNIFGNDYRYDLEAIRHIRNAFAHAPRELKFDSKELSDVCKSLKALEIAHKFNEYPKTAREQFSFSTRTVSMFLILASEMPHRPPQNHLP